MRHKQTNNKHYYKEARRQSGNTVTNIMTKKELKEVCANMDAAATIEYCKGLGLTVKTEKAHRIIYDGDEKIGAVESIQGIKADGTERGTHTPAVKSSVEKINDFFNKLVTLDEMKEDEFSKFDKARTAALKQLAICDEVLKTVNERTAKAAKAAKAEERAAKKAEDILSTLPPEVVAKLAAKLAASSQSAAAV